MKIYLSILTVSVLLSSCAWFSSEPKEDIPNEDEIVAAEEARLAEAENYVSDGIAYYQAGNDTMAVKSWEKALNIIPEDAEVHNFKGISLHRLGNTDEALKSFKKATTLNPKYFQAHNNAGYMLFLKNKYKAAEQEFEQSLSHNPKYEPALRNQRLVESIMLGKLSREVFEISEETARKDEYIEQIEGYKKVLLIDSTYAKAHNNIAVAYYYEANHDSAYYHLERAIKFKKEYPEAINNLGILYKVNQEYEPAIKLFLKALTLKPRYIGALTNLSETYYLHNEIENARRVLNTLIELEPNNKFAHSLLSTIEADQVKE